MTIENLLISVFWIFVTAAMFMGFAPIIWLLLIFPFFIGSEWICKIQGKPRLQGDFQLIYNTFILLALSSAFLTTVVALLILNNN